MKKAILLFVFLVPVLIGYSQDRNNEVYLNYGVGTMPAFSEAFGDFFEDLLIGAFTGATVQSTETNTFGVAGLGYKRNLSKRITLGLGFLYQSFDVTQTVKMPLTGNLVDIKSQDIYYTFMARFDFSYVTTEWVNMYSGVGAGVSVNQYVFDDDKQGKDDNNIYVAWQVNAFGIRVGKTLGGFAEVGFGYAGIVNAGLSLKF